MPTVGIDFGTTKTLVACWDPERDCARPVRLGRGRDDLPTTLYLDTHGELSFGDDADDLRETDPTGYLPRLKRQLARRREVILRQRHLEAVDLAAAYLKYVRCRVEEEAFQGDVITSAILTVPALFGEAARDGLLEAAVAADLNDVQLLEEPLAAGMAFLHEKTATPVGECVLVFDWGGGTLDLALLGRRSGRFAINPELVDGDDMCGGEDIDDLFRAEIAARLQSSGVRDEELQSPRQQWIIARRAREAKHHLSRKEVADIRIPVDGRVVCLPWSRKEFEALIEPVVERAVATLQRLVSKCRGEGEDPTHVLLVGGSSRIPLVADMIQHRIGLAPVSWDYSIEAVAIGAALKASESTIPPKERISAPPPLPEPTIPLEYLQSPQPQGQPREAKADNQHAQGAEAREGTSAATWLAAIFITGMAALAAFVFLSGSSSGGGTSDTRAAPYATPSQAPPPSVETQPQAEQEVPDGFRTWYTSTGGAGIAQLMEVEWYVKLEGADRRPILVLLERLSPLDQVAAQAAAVNGRHDNEYRVWGDVEGRSVHARLVGHNIRVLLQDLKGTRKWFPLQELSAQDRRFVLENY